MNQQYHVYHQAVTRYNNLRDGSNMCPEKENAASIPFTNPKKKAGEKTPARLTSQVRFRY
jgi:hypothetical protein